MTLKIVAEEQGWLDSFNSRYGTSYKQGDIVEENEIIGGNDIDFYLGDEINNFNYNVANGEAIWLEKIANDEKILKVDVYTFGGTINLKMKVENAKKLINEFKSCQNLEISIDGKGYEAGPAKSVIYKLVVDGEEVSKDWDKIIDDVDIYIGNEKLKVEKSNMLKNSKIYKIVADKQKSLDDFNEYFGVHFKNGQKLDQDALNEPKMGDFDIKYGVDYFNKNIANSEAIKIENLEKTNDLTMNEKVRQWARVRKLDTANPKSQLLKGFEELSELAMGVNKQNPRVVLDSMGDIQVVLIILAEQLGVDYEQSLEFAYDEIKHRRGMMIDGTFVKYDDLSEKNQDILDDLEE